MHALSDDDRRFVADLESGRIPPDRFDHRAHVRLAYAYLVERDAEEATLAMRDALLGFLRHHKIAASKYHETLTRAWVLAVRHFMQRPPTATSADEFITAHPALLDSKIMLTHYSAELLFSPEARARFVEPDVEDIPAYE